MLMGGVPDAVTFKSNLPKYSCDELTVWPKKRERERQSREGRERKGNRMMCVCDIRIEWEKELRPAYSLFGITRT